MNLFFLSWMLVGGVGIPEEAIPRAVTNCAFEGDSSDPAAKERYNASAIVLSSQSAQLAQIDARLEELKEMKRGYEARALRHENQAERLQFDDQAYLETRRHLELADENREKAARIQEEIERLEAKRATLVRSG